MCIPEKCQRHVQVQYPNFSGLSRTRKQSGHNPLADIVHGLHASSHLKDTGLKFNKDSENKTNNVFNWNQPNTRDFILKTQDKNKQKPPQKQNKKILKTQRLFLQEDFCFIYLTLTGFWGKKGRENNNSIVWAKRAHSLLLLPLSPPQFYSETSKIPSLHD